MLVGCGRKTEEVPVQTASVSPGPPRHFDVGNIVLQNKLPEEMTDGYLEFGKAPEFSYGMTLVKGRLSARSHERSDMLMYVHAGQSNFNVGDKSFFAGTGDVVYVPRGAIYSAYNSDESQMELLTIYSPPLNRDDIAYHEHAEKEREGVAGADSVDLK
jgi:mannose-6-phosphate isomerase-like protein (cupin superfamily)